MEALIDQFSSYAQTSEAREMVELADKYDVPRNWAKVMTMCLRRPLGAALLWREGVLSFRIRYLSQHMMDMLHPEESSIIDRIYGMAFSEGGVRELLSKWSDDRASALSEMSELTDRVLRICARIKSILDNRERSTPLLNWSLALRDYLDKYKQNRFPDDSKI